MGSEHYCLRWNNHQSNLLGVFSQLLRDESLVDVTLACSEGHSIRAHKVVLSACSSYFQTLFVDHPSRHPIVILKDVRFSELRTLVEFMYKGEVNVEYCQLSALLKTAESLKVKGLAEMTNLNSSSANDDDRPLQQPPPISSQPPPSQQPLPAQTTPVQLTTTNNNSTTTTSSADLMDTDPEQTEPTELVNKRLKDDNSSSTLCGTESPPPAPLSLRRRSNSQPKPEQPSRPHSTESIRPDSPDSDHNSTTPHNSSCGPSDMSMNSSNANNNNNTINTNNNNSTVTTPGGLLGTAPSVCNRLSSPHSTEPVPGPSGMPPIQQVPLSLKKEVDWSSTSFGEEKGECSSEYRHHESMALELERCFGSPMVEHPSTTSAHSSRSSTPFAFPFPTFPGGAPNSLDETSSRLLGLLHPALLGTTAAAAAAAAACAAAAQATVSAEEANFRCPVCLAAFPSLWLLEQHTALQHLALGHFGSEDKPFVCDQCGQSYRYRSAYIKHREQNHRARLPADKLFSCDVCGMQFRYLKSFKKHRLNHALERLHGKTSDHLTSTDSALASNSYDSDPPPENGSSSSATKEEESTPEHGSNQVSSSSNEATAEPVVPAITIKKEITYPDDIAENLSTDSEKLNPNRSDLDQDDTIDSIAFSLTGVGSSNSNSEACRSAQEASILSFLRMDAAERQRERRFACPFCGKCVRSKENLKLHVRKHTGERPFVCLFCGRAFGGKSDLTRHLRIHTGERPYHCEMCGKCFARADYLSKHLTTHIHTPR